MKKNTDEVFKSMVTVQIASLIAFVITGTILTLLVHPQVVGMVPENGYGPLVSWVVSGGVGYFLGGFIGAVVGLIGFYNLEY